MLGFTSDKDDRFLKELTNEIRSGYERTMRALDSHIRDLQADLAEERAAHAETRQLLQRALRLEPRADLITGGSRTGHLEPVGHSKSWPKLRQELEEKFKKKPEDAAADYWAQKAASMEQESQQLEEQITRKDNNVTDTNV